MNNREEKRNFKRLLICHTEASNGWGGQEIRILTESEWFRNAGHSVYLGCAKGGNLEKKAEEKDFLVQSFSFKKWSIPFDIIQLCLWIKRVKPVVLATHSSEDSWSGLIAGRICRVPLLIRYRHVSVVVKPNVANKFLYKHLCDRVITTAECIKKELVSELGLNSEKVCAIPTGIHPPEFQIDRETARVKLAKKLGLSADAHFISCVAVLRSWKGHSILMSAFNQIADRIPSHHLLIVGDGPMRQGLEVLREQLNFKNKIHFLGHVNNPFPIFRGSDLAVLSSIRNEGVPQSLVQAMFSECPVLGTNVGGIPEVVKPDETGWLVDPHSVNALPDGIYKALTFKDKSRVLAANALKFVKSKFTIDHMGKSVENLFINFLQIRNGFYKIVSGKEQ